MSSCKGSLHRSLPKKSNQLQPLANLSSYQKTHDNLKKLTVLAIPRSQAVKSIIVLSKNYQYLKQLRVSTTHNRNVTYDYTSAHGARRLTHGSRMIEYLTDVHRGT